MEDVQELVDAALEQAGALPASRAFRVWCDAYRAGRSDEEAVKRAFRAVWTGLANGRYDDFMRLLANAEARVPALKPDEIVGWAQAAAARAVLELIQARRSASTEAAQARQTRASDIAAAALRFVEAATRTNRRFA